MYFITFFVFGHTMQHMGFQFPAHGLAEYEVLITGPTGNSLTTDLFLKQDVYVNERKIVEK